MVTAGCLGLLLGTGIGLSVGLCMQGPQKPVSHMKAVTVTAFVGVDVSYLCLFSFLEVQGCSVQSSYFVLKVCFTGLKKCWINQTPVKI